MPVGGAAANSSCDVESCGTVVVSVVAGDFHTCAVFNEGSVKCWGYNDQGQLGQGDTLERGRGTTFEPDMASALEPIELGSETHVTAVVIGSAHTCALLQDGRVKCWGGNERGELGLGDVTNRGTGALDDPGMGDALPAVDLGTGRTATSLAAGQRHTCALLDNGQVKCWGNNEYGELGQGDRRGRGTGWDDDPGMGDALTSVDLGADATATAIAAGGRHSCAHLDNGDVKCWGWNYFGQLGLADNVDRGSGRPEDPGMGNALPTVVFGEGRRALSISAGYAHTCALLDNDTATCWGRNRYGQLGFGDTLDRNAPYGGETSPIDLGAHAVEFVAAGGYHTCALLEDGQAKCWGSNKYGQLAQSDTIARGAGADNDPGMGDALPAIELGSDRYIVSIAAGMLHTCFLTNDQSLKCCGSNIVGQLGYSDPFDRCKGDPAFGMGDELAAVPVQ